MEGGGGNRHHGVGETVVAALADAGHGSVDEAECPVPPFPRARIIFFLVDIVARAAEQAQDFAKAAAAAQTRIDGRVIVEIFAVEHGRHIQFVDGPFHHARGFLHVAHNVRLVGDAHQDNGAAQVGASVNIARVTALRRELKRQRRERNGRDHGKLSASNSF
jgi:hypothetical protein